MKKSVLLLALLFGLCSMTWANNIQITAKPQLLYKNTTAKTVFITFPLSWDNSWRSNVPENWDAAWVFAKYREGGTDWNHVYIDTLSSAHRAKANTNVDIKVGTSNVSFIEGGDNVNRLKGLGLFLYRSENGKGTITFDSIMLRWKYADQGLDDEALVSIRVFAIEMVYVPQAPFEPGDGMNSPNVNAIAAGSWSPFRSMGGTGDLYLGDPYNQPGTRKNLFKTMGSVYSPWGTFRGSGTTNPGGWFMEQWSYGTAFYRNNWGASDSYLGGHSLPDPQSNGYLRYSTYPNLATTAPPANNTPPGVERIVLRYPAPYKADLFKFYESQYTTSWNQYMVNNIVVLGSHDSIKWDTLAGRLDSNLFSAYNVVPPVTNTTFIKLNPAKTDSFTYYMFLLGGTLSKPYTGSGTPLYTNTYKMGYIYQLYLIDTTPKGHPENNYYYDRAYRGDMPIRWFGTGIYSSQSGTYGYGLVGPQPYESAPTYPNGYEAFYIMKYELSQHGYVDFLNTLSVPQQRSRAGVDPSTGTETAYHATGTTTVSPTHRNYVMLKTKTIGQPGHYYCYQSNTRDISDYNEQGGNIAMGFLNWADNTAYLCWAGLRPLTELEFEKTCKGPAKSNNKVVSGAFAWGTTNAVIHTGINAVDIYTKKEMITPANANFIGQAPGSSNITSKFPARVGCLATQTSTRTDAGAAYYGAMNMSDNITEFYVNVCTREGLAFDGEHGSGALDGDGNAQVPTWPSNTTGTGSGNRAIINNNDALDRAQIANRGWATHVGYVSTRYGWVGCRGGRTAPVK